ncbi:MAG TPA: hypothetical protein VLC10_03315, partial [Patescibacteria group bacterium]|nr:hypothetical protein [Patescibacteria group bacterium]
GVPRTLRRLAALTAPLAVAAFLLGWYDVARYGSLFDTGYADSLMNEVSRAALDRAAYGLFSAHYIARNVWYYFIQGFSFAKGSALVDKEGWSFLLAAPAFLPAFLPLLVPKRHSVEWAAGTLTFTATIAFFLTYYATGGLQFGPRYLNDALPFLYVSLLLLVQARGLARWHRWVIAGSAACNLLLFADFARHLL